MDLSFKRFRTKERLLICVAVVVVIVVGFVPSGTALNTEGLALLDFKRLVQDSLGVLRGWDLNDISPCSWSGIICDDSSAQVLILALPNASLLGTISPQLGTLSQLRRLELQNNRFTGTIPATLGNLNSLQKLYLQNNNFTGALPDALALLPNLQLLDVSNNNLEGAVPDSYLNLTKPTFFFTGNDMLCGSSALGLPSCQLKSEEAISAANVSQKSWSVLKILLVSVGIFLLFKLFLGILLLHYWLRMDKRCEVDLGKGGKLVMFKYGTTVPTSDELIRAIRRIKKQDVIGEGAYGIVYKIVIKDKGAFAVKKLKKCLESSRCFESELETLGGIKHCNLVNLRGYCIAPSTKLLIYDFLPKGTLEKLLHSSTDQEQKNPVEWATGVRIALGIARALAYIHHSCKPQIVHRDISATNVLLDENLVPHLSDFGMAKLMENGDTDVTGTVAGTFGYISPEYAKTGKATDKLDVYSYGVLLLEIISGRRPTDSSIPEEHVNLASWARKLQEIGKEHEIVQKRWRDTVAHRELATIMEVACRCILLEPDERPRMDKVVNQLESLSELDIATPFKCTPSETKKCPKAQFPGFGRLSNDFLDIIDVPGFKHDGYKFIIDMGHSNNDL